jgi:hypothetical protein
VVDERAGRLAERHVEETRDPVRASRRAGDALLAMVAGLIAVAVANELVIAHPQRGVCPRSGVDSGPNRIVVT